MREWNGGGAVLGYLCRPPPFPHIWFLVTPLLMRGGVGAVCCSTRVGTKSQPLPVPASKKIIALFRLVTVVVRQRASTWMPLLVLLDIISRCTGWPKKVSHYHIIEKSY